MNAAKISDQSFRCTVIRLALCLLPISHVALRAQPTPGKEPAAPGAPVKLDAFVVQSYAESLKKSADAKRAAVEVKDVIVAEDIGEFPDANVAEALQRITGVQIQRTDGEGSYVSVRGVEPNLNLVTIDGRTASSGGFERAFDFSTLSADLVSSIDVIKSQSADMVEGGIGAIIAIKTPKPLDYRKDRVARLSAQTNYLNMTEKFSPKYSGLVSQKFLGGKAGALLSFTYEDKEQRTDRIGNNGWVRNPVANGPDLFTPRFLLIQSNVTQQERIGLTAAFQYRPSDKLLLTLSANANEYTTSQANNAFNIAHPAATGAGSEGYVYNRSGTAVSFSGPPAQAVPIQTYNSRDATSHGFSVDAVWKPADRWQVDLGLSLNKSKSDTNPDDLIDLRVNLLTPLTALTTTYTLHEGRVPDIAIPGFNFLNQAQYGFRQMNLNRTLNKDDELAANLDLDYTFKRGFFTKLETGIRWSDRSVKRPMSVAAALLPPAATNVVPASVLTAFPASNFLEASKASIPRAWMVVDQAKSLAVLKANGFSIASSDTLVSNPLNLFDVGEAVGAAYAKFGFSTLLANRRVHGNIGARYARTEVESNGSQSISNVVRPVSVNRNYGDVLPSFTVVGELRQNLLLRLSSAQVMTRPNLSYLTLSRTVNLERIPVSINDGNAYLDPYRATQSDLSLEWYPDASSLISLALFHKKVKSFVSRVSVSLPFYQELAPGVAIPVGDEVALNQPRNIAGDTVKGFEVNFQKSFTTLPAPFNGLGVTANYTFTKSGEAPRNLIFVDADARLANGTYPTSAFVQLPLEGLSKHSYNVGAFFEKGRFSARVAYNWRDRYLLQSVGLQNTPLLQEDYGQWDGRMAYRLTKKLKLTFDVVNLTDETSYAFYAQDKGSPTPNSAERISSFAQTGRRMGLGLSYDF
ncbi:MAG: TonB-dependent receptor [Opitutaceae bacterium]|nr:TonB-dependent receptor [Opitutaceae bacterium]